ncbi:MAG TPA: hypothetical protein VMX35_13540 [Acidobacteriota bacterium]|nr:hypothetical protein [Acidobacteriota bacterium]
MKLIEAMKELRLIHKRMSRNTDDITMYASLPSTEKPHFGSDEEQRKEVISKVQANLDLFKRYLQLKRRIELTNLSTIIEIDAKKYSLAELLVIRGARQGLGLGEYILDTFRAMNDENAETRMRNAAPGPGGERPHTVRFYDERKKNELLREWDDFIDKIDGKLEVVNATTDIVEDPGEDFAK